MTKTEKYIHDMIFRAAAEVERLANRMFRGMTE